MFSGLMEKACLTLNEKWVSFSPPSPTGYSNVLCALINLTILN